MDAGKGKSALKKCNLVKDLKSWEKAHINLIKEHGDFTILFKSIYKGEEVGIRIL